RVPLAALVFGATRQHLRLSDVRLCADARGYAVHGRTLAAHRDVETLGDGIQLDAHDRPAALHERDAHAELRDVLGELLRAVGRVTGQAGPRGSPVRRVGRLLGQPAVARKRPGDDLVDARVRFAVGGGERVVVPLQLHRHVGPVVTADDGAGSTGGLDRDV